jgi:hypothetical protein
MGQRNFIYITVENKSMVEHIAVLQFHFLYDQKMIYEGNTPCI